jgi:hypothetical protein
VAEWFKAPVLKTGVPARVPWVRIPPLPPEPVDIVDIFRFIYEYAQSNAQLILALIAIGAGLYLAIRLTLRYCFPPDT